MPSSSSCRAQSTCTCTCTCMHQTCGNVTQHVDMSAMAHQSSHDHMARDDAKHLLLILHMHICPHAESCSNLLCLHEFDLMNNFLSGGVLSSKCSVQIRGQNLVPSDHTCRTCPENSSISVALVTYHSVMSAADNGPLTVSCDNKRTILYLSPDTNDSQASLPLRVLFIDEVPTVGHGLIW